MICTLISLHVYIECVVYRYYTVDHVKGQQRPIFYNIMHIRTI